MKQVVSKLAAAGGAAIVVALFVFAFRFQGELPQPARMIRPEVAFEDGDPFPRTVTDYFGDQLTFEGPPQRIGSQALTIDHFLLATTPVERIVALSNYARDERYSFVVDLAESTIDNHKSRLMRKLQVHKAAELTQIAIRDGLIMV